MGLPDSKLTKHVPPPQPCAATRKLFNFNFDTFSKSIHEAFHMKHLVNTAESLLNIRDSYTVLYCIHGALYFSFYSIDQKVLINDQGQRESLDLTYYK